MKKEVARVNLWLYYVSIEYIILRESPELNIIFFIKFCNTNWSKLIAKQGARCIFDNSGSFE